MTPIVQKFEEPYFCADPAEGLKIVDLEPLLAIYQRRSGMTHLVDELVPLLLAPLGEKAMTVDQLINALEHEFSLEADGDLAEVVTAKLVSLEAAGLVWRV